MTGTTTDRRFEDAVVATVSSIPRGEVSTYGEVASESGYPGAARAVGNLLRTTPGLPWWRVVTANGRLVPGNERTHAERLRAEGITVDGDRVRMRRNR